MTTKVARSSQSVTDQARPLSEWLKTAVADSIVSAGTVATGRNFLTAMTAPSAPVYYVSEKAAEAQRQIDRIRSISTTCLDDSAESKNKAESVGTTISLITALLTGPVPIPVASRGEGTIASLFFDGNDFYGDLEVNGKSVEYYIKAKRGDSEFEIFDVEDVKDGYIPPRLLAHLFAHYAR